MVSLAVGAEGTRASAAEPGRAAPDDAPDEGGAPAVDATLTDEGGHTFSTGELPGNRFSSIGLSWCRTSGAACPGGRLYAALPGLRAAVAGRVYGAGLVPRIPRGGLNSSRAASSRIFPGSCTARGRRHGASAADIAVSRPLLRMVSTSSTPSGLGDHRPASALDADKRIAPDTLRHLRSASFHVTTWTLNKSHRCRSGALFAFPITHRTPSHVKARG